MARFLFTVWPFSGHVNPCLSVAEALRAHGHEVSFYTGEGSRSLLEEQQFVVFPFEQIDEGRLWGLIQGLEARAPINRSPAGLLRAVFREWLAGTIPEQVADLRAILGDWRPEVLIADPMMWGPLLVLSETSRIPVAVLSFFIGCPLPGPEAPPWGVGLPPPRSLGTRLLARAAMIATDVVATGLRRELNRIRSGYGLPPMGVSVNAYSARLPLYLVPSVPELDYDRHDLPPSVRYVGPCIWNKPSRAAMPEWIEQLPDDEPWVHVTEGTAHHQDPFVLRAAARGLAHRRIQVILTTGAHRDPSALDLGTIAPNVRVERWVSHSDLLPRCSALVTTGGAGTVMAALQTGVPLVIVPTRWDKPDNARRVVEAGAGLLLPPKQCTPARLRDAVNRVLCEPHFRGNARRLSRRLEEAPGPAGAAEILESLIRSEAISASSGK
jgi:MGT family glycosyltransferase